MTKIGSKLLHHRIIGATSQPKEPRIQTQIISNEVTSASLLGETTEAKKEVKTKNIVCFEDTVF